jgi:hypothetical protein
LKIANSAHSAEVAQARRLFVSLFRAPNVATAIKCMVGLHGITLPLKLAQLVHLPSLPPMMLLSGPVAGKDFLVTLAYLCGLLTIALLFAEFTASVVEISACASDAEATTDDRTLHASLSTTPADAAQTRRFPFRNLLAPYSNLDDLRRRACGHFDDANRGTKRIPLLAVLMHGTNNKNPN